MEVFGLKPADEVKEVEENSGELCEGDTLTPQQFEEYVRVAAYYDYLRRPYWEGSPQEDWANAEAEIGSRFHRG
jgi:hypothetical protein